MAKDYSDQYSDGAFWSKVGKYAKAIGKVPLSDALRLYYAMSKGKANSKQIVAIIAALAYLISPIDAIPDVLGPAGYVDDAGVLAAAVRSLSCCADAAVKKAAMDKLQEWFD